MVKKAYGLSSPILVGMNAVGNPKVAVLPRLKRWFNKSPFYGPLNWKAFKFKDMLIFVDKFYVIRLFWLFIKS